jgi:hypothetical protein
MIKMAIVVFSLFICFNIQGQEKIIMKVLEVNHIGKEFLFDSSSKKDGLDKIHVKYLGIVQASGSGNYKIITWKRIWGPSDHTTGVIFIYTLKNKFIGKYHLGSGFDLPDKIENNNLIFTNKHKINCDAHLVTKVGFNKGLSEEIFLKCKGEYGDVYPLSRNK